MKRRYLVFLLTAFFMLLYMGPANLMPYDAPLAIVQQPQDVQRVDPPSIVATDYDVVLAADSDDDWWRVDTSTHYTAATSVYCRWTGAEYVYFAQMRFQLNIAKDATISSATVSMYDEADGAAATGKAWRIDESNVGSLEDDSSLPTVDDSESADIDFDGSTGWDTYSVTNLVQNQVDLVDWESGFYIGFQYNFTTQHANNDKAWFDYQDANSYHPYMNITYSTAPPPNNVPYTSVMPICSNPDDSDNLYSQLREYDIVVNVTDEDGFADLDYVELSLWSNARTTEYWRVRFDEDTATFSEQSDLNNMITLGTGANVSSGNNLNVTFAITVHWNHTDTTDTDAKVYVRDDETQVQYFADDAKFGLTGASFAGNYPAAYYYNGKTYVGWHGPNDAVDDAGDPYIRSYDHGSGYWSEAVKIATNPLEDDFHGSPALWVDSDGYIHVLYGAHSTHLLQHAISNESESVVDGFTVLDEIGTDVTYPKVCHDTVTDTIHLIYRWVDQGGDHDYFYRYMNSTDDGVTWSSEYTWYSADDGGGQGDGAYPYVLGACGLDPYSRDRIHIAFAIYNETEGGAGNENMYYCYLNLTDLHIYTAAGVDYGVIDSEAELNDNFMVFDTEDYATDVCSVKVDSAHIPYILFGSEYDDSNGHTFFSYWNGSDWETPEVICGTARYSAGGDMVVYASDNITAFLTDGEDMTRWSWDSNSWTKEETILTATSGRDLATALVVAPYGIEPEAELQMIFGEFVDTYDCKGWAWGSNGFLNDTTDDLGWYEVNFDIETRLDFSSFSLNDGSGTVDRGDYDTIDGIVASGVVDYYGSAISPDSTEVDVWVSCSDVEGGPWSDTTLTAGVFSVTVDSDNVVGLDTYSFIVVEKGEGVGGSDLSYTSHSDTYIADRLIVDMQADDETPFNEQQVNFTLTVIYDYDDTVCSSYTIVVSRNTVWWHTFINGNKTLFNDTNSDVAYVYTTYGISESTHGLTEYSSGSESVIWSGEATTTTTTTTATTTETGIFYALFLSLEMWSYLGPIGLVIVGYYLSNKDKFLGVLWFVVECLFVAQYLTLIDTTPGYWWHIFILLLGGLFTCVYPLLDR